VKSVLKILGNAILDSHEFAPQYSWNT